MRSLSYPVVTKAMAFELRVRSFSRCHDQRFVDRERGAREATLSASDIVIDELVRFIEECDASQAVGAKKDLNRPAPADMMPVN